MQNEQEVRVYEKKPIKSGEYDFYIKEIVREDYQGYPLKIKNGNNIGQSYRKFKLLIIEGDDSRTIDKLIFGKKDVKEIVLAINNPALTHVFNQQGDNFEDENLIGEKGRVLIGCTFNKANGKTYPKVECFLKPKPQFPDLVPHRPNFISSLPEPNIAQANLANGDTTEDGVPF